jgi:signal transduction histidine kinase
MAKLHGTDVRRTREKPSIIDPERGEDFFADLRSSFVQATKADQCDIRLAPGWHDVVGQWLGQGAEAQPAPGDPEAVPVSWIKVQHDGQKSEVRVNLMLGGLSAAQLIVTTRRKRGLTQILRTLTTFIPKVSSRLCLRWLRDQAQAYERRRLAQDLHDGPLQIATAAKIRLQSRRQGVEDPVVAKGLDEALDLTGKIIASMRLLIQERVAPSQSDSLKTHLRRAAGRWGELTGMRVHFSFAENGPDDVAVLSRETLEVAERVVSESMMNAWKHGKATHLSVSCRPENGGMLLTLKDDGYGFRSSLEPATDAGSKMGLRLLRSRVDELGGRLDVRSPEGGGTVVETWLPSRQTSHEDPA